MAHKRSELSCWTSWESKLPAPNHVGLFGDWSLCFQGTSEHFLVLFSFHLLILSLDHSQQDFIYEVCFACFTVKHSNYRAKFRGRWIRDDFISGSLTSQGILPLSGLSLQAVSLDPSTSHPPHMFEISSEWTSSAKNTTQCKALNVKYM